MINVRLTLLPALVLISVCQLQGQVPEARTNAIETASLHQPFESGVIFQGGNGLTDMRGGFHFLWAGVHAGRVLTNNFGPGPLRGNFEYAVEAFPYFEAFTPKTQRIFCQGIDGSAVVECTPPYEVGGNYHGVSFTPIIMRWNFARHGSFTPWVQGAGGVLWTNHKFPAYGNTQINLKENGPGSDTSVWNFTPQGGIGLHYFIHPNRSIDMSANAMHISSASLGDRNPGINASVQVTLGYSWWK